MLFTNGIKKLICSFLLLSLSTYYYAESNTVLTQQQTTNLVAFTKVYGYVKYFHPSKQAILADWTAIAIEGSEKALNPKSESELMFFLRDFFAPLAPNIQFVTHTDEAKLQVLNGKIQYWHHRGAGRNANSRAVYLSEIKKGTIEEIQNKYQVNFSGSFHTELTDNITLVLPLAVSTKGNQAKLQKKNDKEYTYNDLSVRLAATIIAWNELQHFFPYWNVVDCDWQEVLKQSLQKSTQDSNKQEIISTLRQMITHLQDGHGDVFSTQPLGSISKTVPVWPAFIEGKIIVKKCSDCASLGIQHGDEIVTINGKSALELLDKKMNRECGSPQLKRKYGLFYLLKSTGEEDSLTLQLKNKEGNLYTTKLLRVNTGEIRQIEPFKHKKVEEIEKGIFYLSLDRMKDEDFEQILPQLENAKGLIFEMKKYTRCDETFLQYLTDKPIRSTLWQIPEIVYPDQQLLTKYDTSATWNLPPKTPYLGDKKIVFITSGQAISYAESLLSMVDHYQLGAIVSDEPTAGANGNINHIELPDHIKIRYTGTKVVKHDGSQLYIKGVSPTHKVDITIDAIREGRDELIEKALEIIKHN